KTTAVIVFLALCGLPVPVTEGSMVGAVDAIMADIGDEQGIEQNLSTFSSHIKRTIHMMETAAPASLLLLDELGAGTDPQEGAALGIAVLQELAQKQCLVLATTHHNPVKAWAISEPGVETASVEFDPVSLSPTFRLMMGIPGRSNALLVAGKLGMPESVIEKARDTLKGGHASVEEIVAELQEKQVHLEAMEAGLAEERRRLSALTRESEDLQNRILSSKDRIISEADLKAQQILAEAEESAKELVKGLEGAAQSAASRHMENRRKETQRMKKEISKREEERIRAQAQQAGGPPAVGDHAFIAGTSTRGVVERINGKKAELRAGLLKIEVPVGKLIRTAKGPEPETPLPSPAKVSRPKHVSSSIMVRGMTIDEAMPNVERYLDQAFRAGHGEVTVIHGRGEGILRREVHALCARLKYVSQYRLGGPGEGGYGVTVVSFGK
ncbi:MAG: Smr/MutS family protein, partial [Synergistota bacterium]|nr:Smr/MutS family protein [Synergistota bacterium]